MLAFGENLSASSIINLIRTKKEKFWSRERERRPLLLFHEAARRVPAYKDFLRKNRINPEKIRTFNDFQLVPPVSKKNYLREYPLEKLCWDGSLKKPLVFTSTSGSTGEPFYFPRGHELDWESSIFHEMYLHNSSFGERGPILVLVCFGMGAWIGGLITYKAFEMLSERGSTVSILTPGINKEEIIKALRNLAPHYAQTIIVGYPPFVKDVVDEALGDGINLKRLNLRILFAAESFTEKFRDYFVWKAGISNLYLDTLNIYGTADIGTMAWETPVTILIRRLALKNQKLFYDIFPQIMKTPTLAQYNPLFITFEAPNGEVLLTGNSTIPLVRYEIGDHGGTLGFREVNEVLIKHGVDLRKTALKVGIHSLPQLPFVYVYERSDFSTKLYGAIIYPEHVREALQEEIFHDFLTGKFTMFTKFDKRQNQFMEVHIELRPKIKAGKPLTHLCQDEIVKHLLMKNAEYRNNYGSIPQKVTPRITFWRYEHPLHFKPGIKQKWVKKEDGAKNKKRNG